MDYFHQGIVVFTFLKTYTIYSEIAYFCSYTLVGNGMSDERFHKKKSQTLSIYPCKILSEKTNY